MKHPFRRWRHIRTTNIIERGFKKVKRRVKVILYSLQVSKFTHVRGQYLRFKDRKKPFYILPMVEGIYKFCNTKVYINKNLSIKLKELARRLEENGPSGKIRIGFTVPLSPLMFFCKNKDGELRYDFSLLNNLLIAVKNTNLPVAFYLILNHFLPSTPFLINLAKDTKNLMKYQDNSIPKETYFETKIMPFSYDLSQELSINQYRFKALRYTCEMLAKFIKNNPNMVIGITIAGEIHHLFPDFMNGMGRYENIKITDYNEASIKSFRKWLKERYSSLEELNKFAGTPFKSWEEVDPPRHDIRKQILRGFWDHFDSYAPGILPVFGWIYHPNGIKRVKIYIDGKFIDNAVYGLNRMDVYEALNYVRSPNVGFRYELDFSKLKYGIHTLDVIATTGKGEKIFVGRRDFVYVDPKQSKPLDLRIGLDVSKMLKIKSCWLDSPRQLLDVYYNPYAKIWNKFRSYQLKRYLNKVARICIKSGVPQNLLFSHELWPYSYGSWNSVLFAIPKSIFNSKLYNPGVTLYGGENFKIIREITKGKPYAVTELHPLQADRDRIYNIIVKHYNAGAVFITPYYMSLLKKKLSTKHEEMLIDPRNSKRGSNIFFNVLKELSRY